ncbi:MAG: DUF1861 family protein [bacterium]|nr:DUF1861 family protein [bacterium]
MEKFDSQIEQNPSNKEHELPIEDMKNPPKSARELFEAFEERARLPAGELLAFEDVGGKDVYNITAPFVVDGKTYIVGRTESRDTELGSQVRFFEERNGAWTPAPGTPTFDLQDPFVTKVGRELILGGTKITGSEKYPERLDHRAEFFRGEHLRALTKFAEGPLLMKGIRLIRLPNGEVAVFTRPQGAIGGRGTIGFMKLPNLEALATINLLEAKLIQGQFRDDEWGGTNELHLLEDNRIGILGHIGYADVEGRKHYYAMAFAFDPETEIASPLTIIAARKNFPASPAKRSPELDDVVYAGGLVRHDDGTATLYASLSDTSAGRITILDPFL